MPQNELSNLGRPDINSMVGQHLRLKQEDWLFKASLSYMVIIGGQVKPK